MRTLTMNGEASSIKFAIFDKGLTLNRTPNGSIQRIGMSETAFDFHDSLNNHRGGGAIDAVDFQAVIALLVPWLDEQIGLSSIEAIGHRVVHGMWHTSPEVVADELLNEPDIYCRYWRKRASCSH